MTQLEFAMVRQPPIRYWGGGIASGLMWLLLIEEDHAYTLQTTEQRYNPLCNLPYGPRTSTIGSKK